MFQGLLLAHRDRFAKSGRLGAFGGRASSPEGYLLALWVHECRRVFSDKLVSLEDKGWVDGALGELVEGEFGGALAAQAADPLHFVDFLREPKRDDATGEVCEPRPRCAAQRGGSGGRGAGTVRRGPRQSPRIAALIGGALRGC